MYAIDNRILICQSACVRQQLTKGTMKTEHTPTPWEMLPAYTNRNAYPIGKLRNAGATKYWDIVGEATGIGGTEEEDKANASFIVRACNAHDELLAACKRTKALIESEYCGRLANTPFQGFINEVEAAIAKAEGK